MTASVNKTLFGTLADGRPVYAYTLECGSLSASVMELGATLLTLRVPDRDGRRADVVFGFDRPEDYLHDTAYQGATVGRFANRIAHGSFTLDGTEYHIYKNDGNNSLHGGKLGLSYRMWRGEAGCADGCASVSFTYSSPDGEEGLPGNVDFRVTYSLCENALRIDYHATTDRRTPVNMTNHTYFNLGGYASGSVLGHLLTLDADRVNELDGELIPTGRILDVSNTPYDFRMPKPIGADIGADFEMLRLGGGYDCNLILTHSENGLRHAATLRDPVSGRTMTVRTTAPCVQLYTSNMMDGKLPHKNGYPQTPRNAVCLETGAMPDSVNHPDFTDIILSPDAEYSTSTVFEFSAE